jgi:DNA polymerase (family 10)
MSREFSNAEIADKLASLAQLLSHRKENFYRAKAYRRAAVKLRNRSESLADMVRNEEDLTQFAGVGDVIAGAIRELVLTGTIEQLETLRTQASPDVVELSSHPRLDPRRVLRIYKKLKISTIDSLREALNSGAIEKAFGLRMAQHVRQGLAETQAMLLHRADDLCAAVEEFLLDRCHVRRADVVGDYRRRTDIIEELAFLVDADDFAQVVDRVTRYGGRSPLLESSKTEATFALPAGILLRLTCASKSGWGDALVATTGSEKHLSKLKDFAPPQGQQASTEEEFYRQRGLDFVVPELREGNDEVERAHQHRLPVLVTLEDLRGELHAHTLASDGTASIEDMARAARDHGYEYIGISDHSQSLKIANGVSEEDLWRQIRFIDSLNERTSDIRILKSAEVDILADGSLDYSDALLRELDYTVCSIHSRFGMNREEQTERILRAMENPYFNILGHATGRLLLKRPGYDIDIERIILHAKNTGCFFEINSSPDRLDLSATHARQAVQAGVAVAINTDAHSIHEFAYARCGVDQARRAGAEKGLVLNSLPWDVLITRLHARR